VYVVLLAVALEWFLVKCELDGARAALQELERPIG
jgi:hypothetical protein